MGHRAIGDHGAPVSLPKLKKVYEKGTRGISWGPLLTPALGQCPSFQMVSPPLFTTLAQQWLPIHFAQYPSLMVFSFNKRGYNLSVYFFHLCPHYKMSP
ncbi:unnamed protein product, partial [Staurois parvus]